MDIYIPFTYLIGWSQYNKFYYGRRTAKNCQPENLWSSYFTSSKYVKEFREEFGEPDVIQIRKTFPNNPKACAIWESKVLKRIDAQHNQKFLNKKNGDFGWDTTGVSLSPESIEKRKQSIKIYWENADIEKKENTKNKISNTTLLRYGVDTYFRHPDFQEKSKQSCMLRFGCENATQSPEIREKRKQTCLKKYGYENATQSPEIREKIKQTWLGKYGCENPAQSLEIQKKTKQTCLGKYGVDNYSKIEKQCMYCGELKNIQHEIICPLNPDRRVLPDRHGENNGRTKTYIIKSPENIDYEVKTMKGVKEFCNEKSLNVKLFINNKIPGWIVYIKEKVNRA